MLRTSFLAFQYVICCIFTQKKSRQKERDRQSEEETETYYAFVCLDLKISWNIKVSGESDVFVHIDWQNRFKVYTIHIQWQEKTHSGIYIINKNRIFSLFNTNVMRFFYARLPRSQPLVLSIAQMDKSKMHTKIPISHGCVQ